MFNFDILPSVKTFEGTSVSNVKADDTTMSTTIVGVGKTAVPLLSCIDIYEPLHHKTKNFGYRPGPTQTGLYKHRRWLQAVKFGFRK